MRNQRKTGWLRKLRDDSGATAIEYALIAVSIAVAIIIGAQQLGSALNDGYANIATFFAEGGNGGGGASGGSGASGAAGAPGAVGPSGPPSSGG